MRKVPGVTLPNDRPGLNLGPEFHRIDLDRTAIYLRRDLLSHAQAIIERLAALRENVGSEVGSGNRGSGFRVKIEGAPELFARLSRRGGMVRLLVSDLYFGLRPRPLQELALTSEAARRGIPVAQGAGALVEWIWPGAYRSAFITLAMPGMTLWEFLGTDDDPAVREHVVRLAREAVDAMYEHGLVHADLNLHNLFVTNAGDRFKVVILDLDKARLLANAVSPAIRERTLRRLLRSALKLDPQGRLLDESLREILTTP